MAKPQGSEREQRLEQVRAKLQIGQPPTQWTDDIRNRFRTALLQNAKESLEREERYLARSLERAKDRLYWR